MFSAWQGLVVDCVRGYSMWRWCNDLFVSPIGAWYQLPVDWLGSRVRAYPAGSAAGFVIWHANSSAFTACPHTIHESKLQHFVPTWFLVPFLFVYVGLWLRFAGTRLPLVRLRVRGGEQPERPQVQEAQRRRGLHPLEPAGGQDPPLGAWEREAPFLERADRRKKAGEKEKEKEKGRREGLAVRGAREDRKKAKKGKEKALSVKKRKAKKKRKRRRREESDESDYGTSAVAAAAAPPRSRDTGGGRGEGGRDGGSGRPPTVRRATRRRRRGGSTRLSPRDPRISMPSKPPPKNHLNVHPTSHVKCRSAPRDGVAHGDGNGRWRGGAGHRHRMISWPTGLRLLQHIPL